MEKAKKKVLNALKPDPYRKVLMHTPDSAVELPPSFTSRTPDEEEVEDDVKDTHLNMNRHGFELIHQGYLSDTYDPDIDSDLESAAEIIEFQSELGEEKYPSVIENDEDEEQRQQKHLDDQTNQIAPLHNLAKALAKEKLPNQKNIRTKRYHKKKIDQVLDQQEAHNETVKQQVQEQDLTRFNRTFMWGLLLVCLVVAALLVSAAFWYKDLAVALGDFLYPIYSSSSSSSSSSTGGGS